MDSEAIAELLLKFAPAHALEELELSRENVSDWVRELDEWGKAFRAETEAFALYYYGVKPKHKAMCKGVVTVSLETIHCLVQMAKIEESGAVENLMDEVAAERLALVLKKKRATVAQNRAKRATPTWHQDALELAAKGLDASKIADRLGWSKSQVRRVLGQAKK